MPLYATTRDPRSIITPDAYEVSPDLLGMPLAPPARRLVAILIDLAVIGVLVLVTSSFALVLGVVAAVFFIRAGFKRTPVRGSVFGRAMRFSVGCFGLFIALVTAALWSAFGIDFGRRDGPRDPVEITEGTITGSDVALGELLRLAGGGMALRSADDSASAAAALRQLVETSREVGVSRATLRQVVQDELPADKPWSGVGVAMLEAILDEAYGLTVDDETTPRVDPELAAELEGRSLQQILTEYTARTGSSEESDQPRTRALRARLLEELAADTLRVLQGAILDLESEKETSDRRLEAVRADLEEERSGGVFGWLRRFVDELGFGFGWASLYLTVILSWWKGQTVGKRILGLRVLRLDGEPITWWVAFERAGGYAAGFATGLLGFAQVYWDANRQAIHDRIVGTVVVLDGAEKVGNWNEAL
jgi:uncharacterized RDD family membrane protein YckC